MDEKPKSIWKKSFTGRKAFVIWLAVVAFIVMLGSFISALTVYSKSVSKTMMSVGIIAGGCLTACLILIYFVWPLLRWLFWTHWRRGLFTLACLVTLIALFYAEEDWRGKHDWDQFKRQWEAKGEHFDFASVVPPPVPDDQNFAKAPVVASCYERILDKSGKRVNNTNVVNRLEFYLGDDYGYRTNGMGNWPMGTMTDLKTRLELFAAKTNLFTIPLPTQSPAHDILQVLYKYDATVEELRQASQLLASRFPLNYDTECPASILLPQLAAMKSSIRFLQLRAIAELQNGQSDQAMADVKLMVRLTEAIRTEPFMISHLVRIAMWQITLQPIYEGLAEHRWTDAELVALDAELAKLDFLADYGFAIRGERGSDIGIIEYLRHARNKFQTLASLATMNDGADNSNFNLQNAMLALSPSGWFDQNELRLCQVYARWYLPVADDQARVFLPSISRGADSAIETDLRHKNPCNMLEGMLLPSLGAAVKKFAWGQASVDLARTAIALERYRLAHGEYPQSLDALAPQFIAKIPHDVIGGQPLKYRREVDGQFVLYSVGWNEKDDGGVVVLKKGSTSEVDISQGDWVWRYPAK